MTMRKIILLAFYALFTILCSCTDNRNTFVAPTDAYTCVSEDGLMKFYSWNKDTTGTIPDYAVFCEYRTKYGGKEIKDFGIWEEAPGMVANVHSLKKNDGTTYYITTRFYREPSNVCYTWMDGFSIDHDTLRHVSVFDGGDDLDECMLERSFKISDWYDTTNGEGGEWLFEYDAGTKFLYLPCATYLDDDNSVFTDRYRFYVFDGMEFCEKGESYQRRLHESLGDYRRLVKYFRTENSIIRVDLMEDGDYRYASWKASSKMSEKPETVIIGGQYDEQENCYTFVDDGVEYWVGYDGDGHGPDDGPRLFLQVKKNGETLRKEEAIPAAKTILTYIK